MKTLILYKSKTGATEQYAKWIKEEIDGADISSIDNFNIADLSKYDQIIIGSRTYMHKISAQNFLEKNWDILKNMKVYLFTVGMIPWEKDEAKHSFEMIPENIRKNLAGHIKLLGWMKTQKMNFFEKLIMKLRSATDKEKEKKADSKVQKENIKPILNWLKK